MVEKISEDQKTRIINILKEYSRVSINQRSNDFVDINNYRETLTQEINFVVFGRRGTGKSRLFKACRDYLKHQKGKNILIYIDCETYKHHTYPDLLIEILRNIFSEIDNNTPFYRFKIKAELKKIILELNKLFEQEDSFIKEITKKLSGSQYYNMSLGIYNISAGGEQTNQSEIEEKYKSHIIKHAYLIKNLPRYERLVHKVHTGIKGKFLLFLDDYYHINYQYQPRTVDYIHLLTKNSGLKYRLATIRHTSNLFVREQNIRIGVQIGAECHELNLDYNLWDFINTREYLIKIADSILQIEQLPECRNLLSESAIDEAVEASGGVPRDFLNIISMGLEITRYNVVTVREIRKAASKYLESTKKEDLKTDEQKSNIKILEKFISILSKQVIEDKNRNNFLVEDSVVSPNNEYGAVLLKLSDLRFMHLLTKQISLSRPGAEKKRYTAFLLDLGLYANKLEAQTHGIITRADLGNSDYDKRRDSLRGPIVDIEKIIKEIKEETKE